MRPKIDLGRLVVTVGTLVAAAALVWLGLLLSSQGLEWADQFGGAAGLVVALIGLLWQVYATFRHPRPRYNAAAPTNDGTSEDTVQSRPLLSGFRMVSENRPPLVGEVDAATLGVKPAIVLEDTQDPPYVRRDVDKMVVDAIAKGGLVVLHGPAASGKTRTAVEAIAAFTGRGLYIPLTTSALAALDNITDAIIWLDDIDRFLSTGYFDVDLLDRICPPRRGGTAVLATPPLSRSVETPGGVMF